MSPLRPNRPVYVHTQTRSHSPRRLKTPHIVHVSKLEVSCASNCAPSFESGTSQRHISRLVKGPITTSLTHYAHLLSTRLHRLCPLPIFTFDQPYESCRHTLHERRNATSESLSVRELAFLDGLTDGREFRFGGFDVLREELGRKYRLVRLANYERGREEREE